MASKQDAARPGVGARVAGLVVSAVCAGAMASEPLPLKLDPLLVSPAPGKAAEGTVVLTEFGVGDLRRRIRVQQDLGADVTRRNAEVSEQIRAYERLLEQFQGLNALQDRALAVLREAVSRPANSPPPSPMARSGAPAAAVPPPSKPAESRRVPPPLAASAASPGPPPLLEIGGVPLDLPRVIAVVLGALVLAGGIVGLVRWRRHDAGAEGLPVATPAAAGLDAVAPAEAAPAARVSPAAAAPAPPTDVTETVTVASLPPLPPLVESEPSARRSPIPGLPPEADFGSETTEELERVIAAMQEEAGTGTSTDVELEPPPTLPQAQLSGQGYSTADPEALKEVDTLIAFEHYEQAKAILDALLSEDPENPEYLLRHYHVRVQGGVETHDSDEALLKAMMDGPLSDTMLRVREIGRTMMPGDALFEHEAARDAARSLLAGEAKQEAGTDTVDDAYLSTVILTLQPDESGDKGGPPRA